MASDSSRSGPKKHSDYNIVDNLRLQTLTKSRSNSASSTSRGGVRKSSNPKTRVSDSPTTPLSPKWIYPSTRLSTPDNESNDSGDNDQQHHRLSSYDSGNGSSYTNVSRKTSSFDLGNCKPRDDSQSSRWLVGSGLPSARKCSLTIRSSCEDESDIVRLASREADYLEVCDLHPTDNKLTQNIGVLRRSTSMGNSINNTITNNQSKLNLFRLYDHLYVSSLEVAYSSQIRCQYGLEYLIDVSNDNNVEKAFLSSNYPCFCSTGPKHSRITMTANLDDVTNIIGSFTEINEFIEKACSNGKKTLIYAARSSMSNIVLASSQYVMHRDQKSVKRALDHVYDAIAKNMPHLSLSEQGYSALVKWQSKIMSKRNKLRDMDDNLICSTSLPAAKRNNWV